MFRKFRVLQGRVSRGLGVAVAMFRALCSGFNLGFRV